MIAFEDNNELYDVRISTSLISPPSPVCCRFWYPSKPVTYRRLSTQEDLSLLTKLFQGSSLMVSHCSELAFHVQCLVSHANPLH